MKIRKDEQGNLYVEMPKSIDDEFPFSLELTSSSGESVVYDLEPRVYFPKNEKDEAIVGSVVVIKYITSKYISEHMDQLIPNREKH